MAIQVHFTAVDWTVTALVFWILYNANRVAGEGCGLGFPSCLRLWASYIPPKDTEVYTIGWWTYWFDDFRS